MTIIEIELKITLSTPHELLAPFPELTYQLNFKEGESIRHAELGTYRLVKSPSVSAFAPSDSKSIDSFFEEGTMNRWKEMKALYLLIARDFDSLYQLGAKEQPLLDLFSPHPIPIFKERRTLHPLDELTILQRILPKLQQNDPEFYTTKHYSRIAIIGGAFIYQEFRNKLKRAHNELCATT